jgi:hypothetical protein
MISPRIKRLVLRHRELTRLAATAEADGCPLLAARFRLCAYDAEWKIRRLRRLARRVPRPAD